jgi:hypothetical protein
LYSVNIFTDKPFLEKWSESLRVHPTVKASMSPNYEQLIINNFHSKKGWVMSSVSSLL